MRALRYLAFGMLLLARSAYGDLLADEKSGVVRVTSGGETGSGFIVRADAVHHEIYVVTAAHVIKNDPHPTVTLFTSRGKAFPCRVLRTTGTSDEALDVAVLLARVAPDAMSGLMVFHLAESQVLRGGEAVRIIGNPVYDRPVWSVVNASVEAVEDGRVYFTGNIGEGHSGSPIILGDQVVGMVVRMANARTTYPSTGVAIDSLYPVLAGTLPTKDVVAEFKSPAFCTTLKAVIRSALEEEGGQFKSMKGSHHATDDTTELYRLRCDLPGMGATGYIREFRTHVPEAEILLSSCLLDQNDIGDVVGTLMKEVADCLPGSTYSLIDGDEQNKIDSLYFWPGLQEFHGVSWRLQLRVEEGNARWITSGFNRYPSIVVTFWWRSEADIPKVQFRMIQHLDRID
jgi:hypothetical protein